jgi:hypothetical protein
MRVVLLAGQCAQGSLSLALLHSWNQILLQGSLDSIDDFVWWLTPGIDSWQRTLSNTEMLTNQKYWYTRYWLLGVRFTKHTLILGANLQERQGSSAVRGSLRKIYLPHTVLKTSPKKPNTTQSMGKGEVAWSDMKGVSNIDGPVSWDPANLGPGTERVAWVRACAFEP